MTCIPVFLGMFKAMSPGEGVGHFGWGSVGISIAYLFPIGDSD